MLTLDHPHSRLEFMLPALSIDSTLAELNLHHFQVESDCLGIEVSTAFERDPLLPGVILGEQGQFLGMISRRRFAEQMSRPYGLELFSRRSLKRLYEFASLDHLVLPGHTLIVTAAQHSLRRSPELLYEPIVVQLAPHQFKLLDVHQLLLAQAKIHELTTQLLEAQTQARLIQTEKMSTLGQMVASVTHEILNPVNFICGNTNHLANYSQDLLQALAAYEALLPQSSTAIDELTKAFDLKFLRTDFPQVITSIKIGAERLRKTISALRNFSHMDESVKRPADLHACLDDTLLILQGRLKHKIEVIKHYGKVPPICCYSGQLSQVFMNLLSNAIDALMETASTSSQADWRPQITITTQTCPLESDWISIQIADNGIGIPPEIQQQIFELFFTTKPVGKGTGLGLTISHQIVTEKHHGRLNVWSQPGVGTQFEILLPIDAA